MSQQKPKILVTRRMPPNVDARLQRDYDCDTNPSDQALTADELLDRARGKQAMVIASSEKLSADVIALLPDEVKLVATFSVGYEHIDVEAAKDRGLIVTNTPDVLTDATADITMLCMLGAARRAHEGQTLVRQDKWTGWYTTMLLGKHVSGSRLGIYGMGRIGRAVAQRARGFNMEIHYHNRNRLPPDLEQGAEYHATPEGLLAVSNFFSINSPSSAANHQFLNADRIACLPDGAVVVNSARGDIVDDEALIAALRSGKVAAAGLDVFAGEPNINAQYRDLENTFLLPHLGSATVETRDAMGFCCCDNLDAYFAGEPCPTALT